MPAAHRETLVARTEHTTGELWVLHDEHGLRAETGQETWLHCAEAQGVIRREIQRRNDELACRGRSQ